VRLETELFALESDGRRATENVKSRLADVAVSQANEYQEITTRRTHFLIIADLIAVIFGLLAVWVRATYRAAVGYESALEERTLEGLAWAAVRKWTNAALAWLEKLLNVDIDGDGFIGSPVSGQGNQPAPAGNSPGNSMPGSTLPPNLQPVSNAGASVVAQGSSLLLVDVSLLKKATRKQWERAFTSRETDAKETNKKKAFSGIRQLEKMGYTVTRWVEDLPGGEKIGRMKISIGDGEEVN
jgi:hypothetical protein